MTGGIGSRLAVRVGQRVELALIAGGRAAPHGADELDRFGELRDPGAGRQIGPPVRPILLFVPARPDTQNHPAAGERLRGGDHLGQMGGVAKAVAEHLVAAELVGIAGERVREERPALGNAIAAVLDVIGQPQRVERCERLVEIWERLLDEPRPDVEADRNPH
jgi:hypothetical protein